MPTWLTIVLSLGGSTLCGLVVTAMWKYLESRHSRIKHDEKEENLQEITTAINNSIAPLKIDIKQVQKSLNEQKETEVLNLRCEMLDIYHRCKQQGYAEEADYITFDELHDRYRDLGGNHYSDFLNNIRKEIAKLPRVSQTDRTEE